MSSAEENKTLVRRFFEAQAEGDLDMIDELLAPDFVDSSVFPDQEPDREGYKRSVAEDYAAFSDIRYIIDDQLAEGDKVTSRVTVRSIHDRAEYLGFAPTGEVYEVTTIFIHRIAKGKIAEEWSEGSGIVDLMGRRLEEVARERERVEQELQVARRIQQASLPREVPALRGWEIAPYYQPAREVGGDFYDFHLLPEGRLGVVVGDATGKGVPAALVMSTTCGMLRAVSQAMGSYPPGEVLELVNEALVPNIPPNMFVTCFYGVLDPKSGHLSYANAGHDLPYVRTGGGEVEELRARGMPLGLMPGMSYEQKEIILEAGDSVLFYSDGLVEAHDPKGEMFGFPRLQRLVGSGGGGGGANSSGEGLVGFLLEELHSFAGDGWEQEDDISLTALYRLAE